MPAKHTTNQNYQKRKVFSSLSKFMRSYYSVNVLTKLKIGL